MNTAVTVNEAELAFEEALIACSQFATDGSERRVRLIPYVGVPSSQQLREITFEFLQQFDVNAMYIQPGPDGKLIESKKAEAAAWRNLALLAIATAAALCLDDARTPASS